MAKTLEEWIATDVAPVKDEPVSWLSQNYFFRDPARAAFSDTSYFFSPADGIILYQGTIEPDDPIVDIKGRPYSLREAMHDDEYDKRSVVIGVFMSFYDVHINRIPYPGRLSYRLVDPIDTLNHPMLDVEHALLEQLHVPLQNSEYLHKNQRVVNRIDSPYLDGPYYVLQIADYDVDSITPFELKQNQPAQQGHRFSQIRYGSQVDLIVPVSPDYDLVTTQETGSHVEAGIDPLISIRRNPERNPQ